MQIKILTCRRCGDMHRIQTETRTCACGASKAQYISARYIVVHGPAMVLGMSMDDLMIAMAHADGTGEAYPITATIVEAADNTVLKPRARP